MQIYNFLENEIKDNAMIQQNCERFNGKTVLVTGATGLLGSMICMALSCLNNQKKLNIKIIAMVRNKEKAINIFGELVKKENIFLLEQNIIDAINIKEDIDYIIHTACPTASNIFIEKPVETIATIINGTENVLNLAKRCKCKSIIYFSSMEVYGEITHENPLKPEDIGYINPLNLRSCYPEGKRMVENMCMAYFTEYGVPVKIIRYAQTFGPGIPKNDKRVFSQFINSVMYGDNIVLYTEGKSKRMYLDTVDAITACFLVLLKGDNGKVYNAANPETYCSIREMADMVIKEFGGGRSKLLIDKSKDIGQYPPANKLFLDIEPLKKLGWVPKYNLKEIYNRMIKFM